MTEVKQTHIDSTYTIVDVENSNLVLHSNFTLQEIKKTYNTEFGEPTPKYFNSAAEATAYLILCFNHPNLIDTTMVILSTSIETTTVTITGTVHVSNYSTMLLAARTKKRMSEFENFLLDVKNSKFTSEELFNLRSESTGTYTNSEVQASYEKYIDFIKSI